MSRLGWRYIAGAVFTAAILFLIWYFKDIVLYILISAVLAIVGRPLVNRLSQLRIRGRFIPRSLAAFATLVTIWVVFVTAFSLFVPLVAGKIYELATLDFSSVLATIEVPIKHAQEYLSTLFMIPESNMSLSEVLASSLGKLIDYNTVNTAFSSIINIGVSFVVAFFSVSFITFFFLKED